MSRIIGEGGQTLSSELPPFTVPGPDYQPRETFALLCGPGLETVRPTLVANWRNTHYMLDNRCDACLIYNLAGCTSENVDIMTGPCTNCVRGSRRCSRYAYVVWQPEGDQSSQLAANQGQTQGMLFGDPLTTSTVSYPQSSFLAQNSATQGQNQGMMFPDQPTTSTALNPQTSFTPQNSANQEQTQTQGSLFGDRPTSSTNPNPQSSSVAQGSATQPGLVSNDESRLARPDAPSSSREVVQWNPRRQPHLTNANGTPRTACTDCLRRPHKSECDADPTVPPGIGCSFCKIKSRPCKWVSQSGPDITLDPRPDGMIRPLCCDQCLQTGLEACSWRARWDPKKTLQQCLQCKKANIRSCSHVGVYYFGVRNRHPAPTHYTMTRNLAPLHLRPPEQFEAQGNPIERFIPRRDRSRSRSPPPERPAMSETIGQAALLERRALELQYKLNDNPAFSTYVNMDTTGDPSRRAKNGGPACELCKKMVRAAFDQCEADPANNNGCQYCASWGTICVVDGKSLAYNSRGAYNRSYLTPYVACYTCLLKGRRCERKRPCDSCVMNNENCFTQGASMHGCFFRGVPGDNMPVYYRKSGYGPRGVNDVLGIERRPVNMPYNYHVTWDPANLGALPASDRDAASRRAQGPNNTPAPSRIPGANRVPGVNPDPDVALESIEVITNTGVAPLEDFNPNDPLDLNPVPNPQDNFDPNDPLGLHPIPGQQPTPQNPPPVDWESQFQDIFGAQFQDNSQPQFMDELESVADLDFDVDLSNMNDMEPALPFSPPDPPVDQPDLPIDPLDFPPDEPDAPDAPQISLDDIPQDEFDLFNYDDFNERRSRSRVPSTPSETLAADTPGSLASDRVNIDECYNIELRTLPEDREEEEKRFHDQIPEHQLSTIVLLNDEGEIATIGQDIVTAYATLWMRAQDLIRNRAQIIDLRALRRRIRVDMLHRIPYAESRVSRCIDVFYQQRDAAVRGQSETELGVQIPPNCPPPSDEEINLLNPGRQPLRQISNEPAYRPPSPGPRVIPFFVPDDHEFRDESAQYPEGHPARINIAQVVRPVPNHPNPRGRSVLANIPYRRLLPNGQLPENRVLSCMAVRDDGTQCGALARGVCEDTQHCGDFAICDQCEEQSSTRFRQALENIVQPLRAYACHACEQRVVGDATPFAGTNWRVWGFPKDTPVRVATAGSEPPFLERGGFEGMPMLMTGCACATKMLGRRICNPHRFQHLVDMWARVVAMQERQMQVWGRRICPFCLDRAPVSSFDFRGNEGGEGQVHSWQCLSCSDVVVDQAIFFDPTLAGPAPVNEAMDERGYDPQQGQTPDWQNDPNLWQQFEMEPGQASIDPQLLDSEMQFDAFDANLWGPSP